MKLTDLFIRRPVLAIVVNFVILLAGYQSIRSLNVRQYPRSDLSVVSITTIYVGANADLVRGFLTTPLERVIASAEGIDYMESTSAQGLSTINVHLKLNYDTNAALTQIQAKVAQVRNDLPPEAEAPVINVTTTDDQIASMYLSFYSDDLEANQITDYLTRVVQPKLSSVNGVRSADILGARTFAMRIWLKPDRMASLNVSPTDVRNALAGNNYLSAIGATKGSMISVNLVANTDLNSAQEFENLVVRQDGNTITRLRDVANVVLGAEDYTTDVRFDGSKATFMGIFVLPTANTLDVIHAVRKLVPEIEKNLPAGMHVGVPYDSTKYIEDAINEVTHTLAETLLIVVVVIFLFLGSFRSVLIPVLAIPISLIGTAFIMICFGFTLNLLTLLAIVLSVGLVVDDAIVVVENVERHMHEGESPFQAAIHGARELVGPIIAMTITLIAVYAPIGIQGGLTGTLFREFAFTLAGAVTVSAVVALTLSPMLSSRLLKPGGDERGYAGWVTRRFAAVQRIYTRLLIGTLEFRAVTLAVAVLATLLIVPFYFFSTKELAPKEDQGVAFGIVQAAPNSTLDQTTRYTDKFRDIFTAVPEKEHVFQLTFPSGDAAGFSGMVAKPFSERHRSIQQILPGLTKAVAALPGINGIVATPQPLPGGSNFDIEFVVASTGDPRQLQIFAKQIQAKLVASKLSPFSFLDLKYDQPQAKIVFDRDKVAAMGLNLGQVGADLSTMLGGNYVNRFSISGRSYEVIPQVTRTERLNPDQLGNFYVSGPAKGKLVPLSTFAHIETTAEPRSLSRFQQLNSVKISGVLMPQPGVTLDAALKVMEDEAKAILPRGYVVDYAGASRQLRVEGSKFLPLLVLSLILIFLVLAAQFESFSDPLIILLGSVPLALTGALIFSFLGETSLNIYANVGLVTLVGLVSKNGILIVEFANTLQEQGRDKFQAIVEGASTRLRPILMTSAATVAGHAPLIFATGPGAGARNSIGWIVVTGMIIGTGFTLFVVPTFYMYLARDRSRMAHGVDIEKTGEHLTIPASLVEA